MKRITHYKEKYRISFADYGEPTGFPILVNHGLIASIDDDSLFDRLVQWGARLICVARPGYGESCPYEMQTIGEWGEIVAILIDALSLSRFDVLGMSSGAPYSYALGHRFPDKVRNIYIFSGIPALYDDEVLSHWPYPVKKDASLDEMKALAYELLFSQLTKEALERNDIKDSVRNHCFGIAQDWKIRCLDWGFRLSDITAKVYLQHSKEDTAVPFITAYLTSKLLPNHELQIREHGEHFSPEILDEFIECVIGPNFDTTTLPGRTDF